MFLALRLFRIVTKSPFVFFSFRSIITLYITIYNRSVSKMCVKVSLGVLPMTLTSSVYMNIYYGLHTIYKVHLVGIVLLIMCSRFTFSPLYILLFLFILCFNDLYPMYV